MAERDFSEAAIRKRLFPHRSAVPSVVFDALITELAAIAACLPPAPSDRSPHTMGGRPPRPIQVADLDPTPTHTSTKNVRTYEITCVDLLPAGVVSVRLPDGTVTGLAVSPTLDRGRGLSEGDRLIVYQDDYVSWCPAAVFERDYRPIGEGADEQPPAVGTEPARPLLMTYENPTGWKLEDLAHQLMQEMEAKTAKILQMIADEQDEVKKTILRKVRSNNTSIIEAFGWIRSYQIASMEAFAEIGPDQGPTGKSRVGDDIAKPA